MVCHVWIIVVRDADQDKESFLDPGNFDPTHLDPRLENSLNKYPHGQIISVYYWCIIFNPIFEADLGWPAGLNKFMNMINKLRNVITRE